MSTSTAPQGNTHHGPTSLSKAAALKTKLSNTAQQHTPSANSTVKSKKDPLKVSNTTIGNTLAPTVAKTQPQMKRRASKPIINWFRGKLGTVRPRRASDAQRYGASSPRGAGKDKQQRRLSVPVPPPLTVQSRTRSTTGSKQARPYSHRGTISLNESSEVHNLNDDDDGDHRSIRSVSDDGDVARESLYSPASYLEADEDASVRPLPPSSPPSPSPSGADSSLPDSSSYISQPRTFMSLAASTKPTTVLSVDLHGGMAHIAQAPLTPSSPAHIPPHVRTHSSGPSSGSITFSSFPPQSPMSPSRPVSGNSGVVGTRGATLTAPLYTTHHPRNNPRPSSPPPDDASVLTLASSAFGIPGARIGVTALAMSGRGSFADDSVSQWSNTAGLTDSTSQFGLGDLEEGRYNNDQDVNASVRALRPRSSRRGSWDSTASGWSANVAAAPSPGGKPKGGWMSGSYRTGGFSTVEDGSDDETQDDVEEGDGTVATDSSERVPSTLIVEPSSPVTEDDARTPPTLSAAIPASTLTLPGSKKEVPAAMASTVVLPGSKAVSQAPSPGPSSTTDGHSGVSTPTKPDGEIASAELNAKVDALKLEEAALKEREQEAGEKEGKDELLKISVEVVPFSAASTVPSEYLSAPSSPAPV